MQAIYNLISPGWFVTPVFGDDHFLFRSGFFWLCLPLTVCIALAPRYIAKAWKFGFAPDDIDIMRYVCKMEPNRDIAHDATISSHLAALRRPGSITSRRTSHAESVHSRPSLDHRTASRTDMSTGIRSMHRGFNFAMEENGVAMRRMQSNLSERRQSSRDVATAETPTRSGRRERLLGSLRGRLKRKPSNSRNLGA